MNENLFRSRLGVGPMSGRSLEAMSSVAVESQLPLMVIASRRQVDHRPDGGGYVERWDTPGFAEAVRAQNHEELLLLCRDHGGPWQQPNRVSRSTHGELNNARDSFFADIDADFDLLQIDTSKSRTGTATHADAVSRLIWMYSEISRYLDERGTNIEFEIGFEVQGVETNVPSLFQKQLVEVLSQLSKFGLKKPMFVVAQTGTKVVEDRNTGEITRSSAGEALDRVAELAEICHSEGVRLKAHNADYLESSAVRALMESGVDAINIAPQLGTLETTVLMDAMAGLGAGDLEDAFIALALREGRWKSWVVEGRSYDDKTLARLGGHYVFATEEARAIRAELDRRRRAAGMSSLDDEIAQSLSELIRRYSNDTSYIDQIRRQTIV